MLFIAQYTTANIQMSSNLGIRVLAQVTAFAHIWNIWSAFILQ